MEAGNKKSKPAQIAKKFAKRLRTEQEIVQAAMAAV
jgi:hypothetical protein